MKTIILFLATLMSASAAMSTTPVKSRYDGVICDYRDPLTGDERKLKLELSVDSETTHRISVINVSNRRLLHRFSVLSNEVSPILTGNLDAMNKMIVDDVNLDYLMKFFSRGQTVEGHARADIELYVPGVLRLTDCTLSLNVQVGR